MDQQRERGFSILEILVVVMILGLLAAIAIWNYYEAINRARQRRTMADIRTIAVAWEARAVDMKAYNAAGFTMPVAPIAFSDMTTMLAPTYVRNMPKFDGWGRALDFAADSGFGSSTQANTYALRSPGRDGVFSGTTYVQGTTTSFDCDIVYSGGTFIVWPAGGSQ